MCITVYNNTIIISTKPLNFLTDFFISIDLMMSSTVRLVAVAVKAKHFASSLDKL